MPRVGGASEHSRRMRCGTSSILAAACLGVFLLFPAIASAGGGRYVFDGGTQAERAQVRAALQASTFDWNIVPGQITIHVERGVASQAAPGQIWLEAGLLDAGRYSWAVIQHEYAHQVDYLVLTDSDRAALQALLGGTSWCSGGEGFAHDANACERFATSIAWAYWPSPQNAFDPGQTTDEGWLRSAPLRTLLGSLLGVRDPYDERTPAGARKQHSPHR
jgi:hypothetical protein